VGGQPFHHHFINFWPMEWGCTDSLFIEWFFGIYIEWNPAWNMYIYIMEQNSVFQRKYEIIFRENYIKLLLMIGDAPHT
jgi:hypothetical protein